MLALRLSKNVTIFTYIFYDVDSIRAQKLNPRKGVRINSMRDETALHARMRCFNLS